MAHFLECEHCNYKSNRLFNLNRHVITKHTNKDKAINNKPTTEKNKNDNSFVKKEELYRIIKDIGWIYCITSSEKDIYKCGNITNLYDEIKCKKFLNTRYGIVLVNMEIIHIVNVSNAKVAEKDLFNLLVDIKYKRELYKTEDINYIINQMNSIGKKYAINKTLKNKINEYKDTINNEKEIMKNNDSNNKTCDKCSKTFSRSSYLKIHIEKCNGTKRHPLKCMYCDKLFSYRSGKYEHQKICKNKYIANDITVDNYNFSKAQYIGITLEIAIEHISNGLNGFIDVINIIYFNDKLPSLIKLEVTKTKIVKIKEFNNWIYDSLDNASDKIINNILNQFSNIIDNNQINNFILNDKYIAKIKKHIYDKLLIKKFFDSNKNT